MVTRVLECYKGYERITLGYNGYGGLHVVTRVMDYYNWSQGLREEYNWLHGLCLGLQELHLVTKVSLCTHTHMHKA